LYGRSAVVSILIVVLANFLLIPRLGAYGAAWATVITFAIRLIIVVRYAQNEYYIDFGWMKNLQMMVLFISMVIVRFLWPTINTLYSILLSFGFTLFFIILIYKFFIDELERDSIKHLIQQPRLLINIIISKAT